MRKEVLLLLMVILASQAYAADDWFLTAKSAKLSQELGADIRLESTGAGSYINYVQADLSFVPRDTPSQSIDKITITPEAQETDVGLRFRWTDPDPQILKFKVETVITTQYHLAEIDGVVPFPLDSDDIPSSIAKYTQPSEYIDSDNPAIIKQASTLAEGETDLYEVVFNVAEWVMQNLRYDLTVGQRVETASWILEHQRGVCDEYSTLYIGLVRSLGIPARYVSGVAYSNLDIIQGFGPHAWVEVYFPGYGWIPFDFTYAELGYVDSTHIKLRESLDPGESSTRYEWEAYNVKLNTEPLYFETEVLGHGDMVRPLLDISIKAAKDSVGYGSYNLFTVTLENDNDYYVPTSVQISQTNGLEIDGPVRQFALLKPNSKSTLTYLIQVSENLEDGYVYTFPISATTSRNASAEVRFTARKGEPVYTKSQMQELMAGSMAENEKSYSQQVDLLCEADKYKIYADDSVNFFCTVSNSGNTFLESLSVCQEEDCRTVDIGIGRSERLDFQQTYSQTGKLDVMFTAKNDEISKTDSVIIDVQEQPAIVIQNITFPPYVNSSEKFVVSFVINKESLSSPDDIEVALGLGANKKTWPVGELDTSRKFLISLEGKDLYKSVNEFEIKVTYSGLDGEPYEATENFVITQSDPAWTSRMLGWSEDMILGVETLDWKVLLLAAGIFGIVIGVVFKKKPRKRALW